MKATGLEWALTLLGFAIGVTLMIAGLVPQGSPGAATAFIASAIGYGIARAITKQRRRSQRQQ